MFNNPGRKLSVFAYIWFFLRTAIGIIAVVALPNIMYGISYYTTGNSTDTFGTVLLSILLIIVQIAIAYFESLLLSCFASITENVEYLADSNYQKGDSDKDDDMFDSIKPL